MTLEQFAEHVKKTLDVEWGSSSWRFETQL